jgi:GNAT superfamily N-acetyltransferase
VTARFAAAAVAIRAARPADLDAIVRLCAAHAAYERAALPGPGLRERLAVALFGAEPRATCFVAEIDGRVEGYAACALEFSTWRGGDYLHLDCLFVEAGHRGHGVGRRLVDAVARHAADLGIAHVEWQTPAWNTAAVRFYERLGATAAAKLRFTWRPGPA